MSPLPVRDLADAPLAPLFDRPGCPLCRRISEAEQRFIDGLLYERVNDVRFRAELDAARGFCGRHVAGVLEHNRRTAGALSSAILFRALIRVRRREVDEARGSGGRGRARRLAAAAAPPDCPVCAQASATLAAALGSLIRLAAEPAWAEAIASAPFCLDHLVALMSHSRWSGELASIEARQVARLTELEERLDRYAHHSSSDRQHLLTDEERAAVDEAAALLGG